jgi:hypothetical protein
MINDRPINDPALQKALGEIQRTMRRYGFAGACVLIGREEAAFTYKLDAPWSGIRGDAFAPLGFRIRINSAEDGPKVAREQAEGAAHTVCQLSDFGSQTMDWMEQLKLMLREAGINFDHNPFGGQPPGPIVPWTKPE